MADPASSTQNDHVQPYVDDTPNLPVLNEGQAQALGEIMAAYHARRTHLVTGYAGSGKTTLMQHVAWEIQKLRGAIVLSAPTHKAVAVLAQKVRQARLEVPCSTIHSLLSLFPLFDGPRLTFGRRQNASEIDLDAVVIDECSMIGAELFELIQKYLQGHFVLFVGDPAQLPPINESESPTFSTESRSHLATVVRQAAGNPILQAAQIIRESQGRGMDYSWVRSAKAPPLGVFIPQNFQGWMNKAFTSLDFEKDPDAFRYLCWTNHRVAEINAVIREWRYGKDIPNPFVVGERVLIRQPVFGQEERDPATGKMFQEILFNTNEEADVADIRESTLEGEYNDIEVSIPTWSIVLVREDGMRVPVHFKRDTKALSAALHDVKSAVASGSGKWKPYHMLRAAVVKLQSVYAMTVHCSQGSTFGNVFLDLNDIKRRAPANRLECQQMLYVAATRPSTALILVNT